MVIRLKCQIFQQRRHLAIFFISFKIKPDVTFIGFTTKNRIFTPFWYQNCKNCKVVLPIRIWIWLKYSWNLLMCKLYSFDSHGTFFFSKIYPTYDISSHLMSHAFFFPNMCKIGFVRLSDVCLISVWIKTKKKILEGCPERYPNIYRWLSTFAESKQNSDQNHCLHFWAKIAFFHLLAS